MQESECVSFLQWALPQLQMRWAGYRRVHKQVCKRLAQRLSELSLNDLASYRRHLAVTPAEWQQLDSLCRVVVTRFYRDKRVFTELLTQVMPPLAREAECSGRKGLSAWSIGSASGEEAYTLAILWHHLLAPEFAPLQLSILGTEVDAQLIARSHRACYPAGTIRNLPEALRRAAFRDEGEHYCLKSCYRAGVEFRLQDIRSDLPEGPFDLILCRNLVFTYFDEPLQQATLARILSRLRPGGWLLLGVHESLPAGTWGLEALSQRLGLYRYG